MKELWKKYSMWDKISIYVLGAMLAVMILGLILIGTYTSPSVTMTTPLGPITVGGLGGFDILKNTSISDVLKADGFAQLKTGIVFAVIFTPILLITSLGIFGYSFYLKKEKKVKA